MINQCIPKWSGLGVMNIVQNHKHWITQSLYNYTRTLQFIVYTVCTAGVGRMGTKLCVLIAKIEITIWHSPGKIYVFYVCI